MLWDARGVRCGYSTARVNVLSCGTTDRFGKCRALSVQDSSCPAGSTVPLAAARPSVTPRWNPASRSRAAVADRFGKAGCVLGMAPGIRFAFGDRLGSPAAVSPLEDGESTVCAARQPSSAGDAQPLPAAAVEPDRPGALLLPLNQFDSTSSNMGNLRVCSGSSAGGTTTLPSLDGRPVRRVLSVMSPAASWPKTWSGWPEAPAYSPIAAGSLGYRPLTAGARSASDFNRRPSGVSLWPGYTAAASCEPGLDPASPKRSSLGAAASFGTRRLHQGATPGR